jgi:hypothetical protein
MGPVDGRSLYRFKTGRIGPEVMQDGWRTSPVLLMVDALRVGPRRGRTRTQPCPGRPPGWSLEIISGGSFRETAAWEGSSESAAACVSSCLTWPGRIWHGRGTSLCRVLPVSVRAVTPGASGYRRRRGFIQRGQRGPAQPGLAQCGCGCDWVIGRIGALGTAVGNDILCALT